MDSASVTCTKSHALVASNQVYHHNRYTCNACGEHYDAANDMVRHCELCNFDLCPQCFSDQTKVGLRCPQKHRLFKVTDLATFNEEYNGNIYMCDGCGRARICPFHPVLHCPLCSYDLCGECGNKNTDVEKLKLARYAKMFELEKKFAAQTISTTASPKLKGYYFTGSWCPACEAVTPIVSGFYKNWKQKDSDFEIFAVGIKLPNYPERMSWEAYTKTMPWKSIPFDSAKARELDKTYEISGYPTLVIVNTSNNELITLKGIDDIFEYREDREETKEPFSKWLKKAK